MAPKLLEGDVLEPEDEVIRLLKRELADVRRDLDEERANASRRDGQALQAIKALRKTFLPMYRTLQAVFGEIEAVVSDAELAYGSTSDVSPDRSGWGTWQQKLGVNSPASRMIGVLLDHGPATTKQVMASAKMGEATVYKAASKLGQLKLVEKSGGRYALRKL